MEQVVEKIHRLLQQGTALFMHAQDEELERKAEPEKWSKKEILGHLIDSALHNLVRFTEAQYADKPYHRRAYDQNELVRINEYQHQETEDLLVLWLALNRRIAAVIAACNDATLSIPVVFSGGSTADLRFLMTDYADHLEHHLRQIDRNLGR